MPRVQIHHLGRRGGPRLDLKIFRLLETGGWLDVAGFYAQPIILFDACLLNRGPRKGDKAEPDELSKAYSI